MNNTVIINSFDTNIIIIICIVKPTGAIYIIIIIESITSQ